MSECEHCGGHRWLEAGPAYGLYGGGNIMRKCECNLVMDDYEMEYHIASAHADATGDDTLLASVIAASRSAPPRTPRTNSAAKKCANVLPPWSRPSGPGLREGRMKRLVLIAAIIATPFPALAFFDVCWGNVTPKEGHGVYVCKAEGAATLRFDSRQPELCAWGSARELQVRTLDGRKVRIPAGDKFPYYECHREKAAETVDQKQ